MRLEPRTAISAEARGRLRALWAHAKADADLIEAAANRVPRQLLRDTRLGLGKRGEAAVDAIMQLIPIPALVRERRSAAWRFLRPRPSPGPAALQVIVLLLNAPGSPGLWFFRYGFAASPHALGRLLDRTRFHADPVQAVLGAHNALFALEHDELVRLLALPDFQLPAGPGCFLVAPDAASEQQPAAIARTWVGGDQLFDDQEQHAAAWARLLRSPPPAGTAYEGTPQ